MARVHFSPALAPEMPIQDKPDHESIRAEASVQQFSDELVLAAQLANDNSWRSDDIEMADATANDGTDISEPLSPLTELNSDDDIGESESEPEERAMTPQSEVGIDKLDKYAFNFKRGAYNHRVPQHLTTGSRLNVAKVTSQPTLAQYRQKLHETGEEEKCPPLIPMQVERAEIYWGPLDCIWVGMLPSQASHRQGSVLPIQSSADIGAYGNNVLSDTKKKPTKKKAPTYASVRDLAENDITVVPFDAKALRVVAKKSNKATKTWCLYALVVDSSRIGLCQGYKVSMDDVYFFKGFRDDLAKSFMPRKQATQELIRMKIFPTLPSPAPTGPSVGGQVDIDAVVTAPTSLGRSGATVKIEDNYIATAMLKCISEAGASLNSGLEQSHVKDQGGLPGPIDGISTMDPIDVDTESDRGKSDHAMAATEPIVDDPAVLESHKGDDDGQSIEEGNGLEPEELTKEIMKIMNRFAATQDLTSLDQALIMLKSLEDGRQPSRSSVLGLYLNVPVEGDTKSRIDMEKLLVSLTLADLPSPFPTQKKGYASQSI